MNNILYQTSPIWKRIETQTNDAITDFVMLFAYKVRRTDRPQDFSQLLTEGKHFFKLNEAGKAVENVIKDVKLKDCQVDWYSINANDVNNEASCDNVSFIVYAHWDIPCTLTEAQKKILEEIEQFLEKPINEVLKNYNAMLLHSAFDHGSQIYTWEDRDELLVGDRRCRFTPGHF